MYKKNTICQKLVKLRPAIDHKEAYKLSNHFYKIAKQYRLDHNLLISIAFQESAFNLNAVRKITGLFYDQVKDKFEEIRVGADFCMMQINTKNIRKMKLSVKKLLIDPAYCIESGAKILKSYQVLYANKDLKWWTYYNAIHSSKRDIYFHHVTRHLRKISDNKGKRSVASQ